MPNIPAIPGMNPGIFILGGGGSGGPGGGGGAGGQGAGGGSGGDRAGGGGKSAPDPNRYPECGTVSHPIDVVTGRVFTHAIPICALPGPLRRARPTAVEDRNGNRIALAYDEQDGRLAEVIDSAGRCIRLRDRTAGGQRVTTIEVQLDEERGEWLALGTLTCDPRDDLVAATDAGWKPGAAAATARPCGSSPRPAPRVATGAHPVRRRGAVLRTCSKWRTPENPRASRCAGGWEYGKITTIAGRIGGWRARRPGERSRPRLA
ncbi:hypothetical protein [Sorangium sp. So ce887]|uniref:hypothetical protein n=1 Tax=Sorangium sp. So ce887 TaxID=3133324 RepID=UPI003F5EF4CB